MGGLIMKQIKYIAIRKGQFLLIKRSALMGILILAAIIPAAFAQTNTGTTIGQFLLIEPSARYAGMGNAAVAAQDEIAAAWYNPAAIGRLRGYGVQFTHSLWLADITYDYASAMISVENIGNLLVNVTSLNSGEIDVRTVDQEHGTGERYSVSDIALGLGFGRKLTDRFSMGLQINYIQQTIWHSTLSTVALNIGTLFDITKDGLRLGASLSNYGLPSKYSGRDIRIMYDLDAKKHGDNSTLPGEVVTGEFPLPLVFRVGLSYPMQLGESHKLHLAVNAFHPNDNNESISLGAEWLMMNTLALRAGYQNLFLKDSEAGLTLGAGFQLKISGYNLSVDYAWADYGRLINAQRFTAGIMF
jgi:long-subunit fatty acid transport protein